MLDYQRAILELMGVDLPVRVVAEPSRVGELVVPGQGFGLGEISRGTPEMRAMIHRRFGASIKAEGPRRLYLSRSGLGEAESMILGETVLEGHLMANGYEIFHPQNHDLATQIARYKAAREIIVADGSAAHLFGMVGGPDQRVAFLMRRSYWSEFPLLHLEHFCGRKPDVVDAVRREWLPVHPNRHKHVSYGEMDLPMVQRGLVKTGYIAPGGMSWPPLSETVAEAAFLHMGLAGEFRPGSG